MVGNAGVTLPREHRHSRGNGWRGTDGARVSSTTAVDALWTDWMITHTHTTACLRVGTYLVCNRAVRCRGNRRLLTSIGPIYTLRTESGFSNGLALAGGRSSTGLYNRIAVRETLDGTTEPRIFVDLFDEKIDTAWIVDRGSSLTTCGYIL